MRPTLFLLSLLAPAIPAAPAPILPRVQLPYTFELNQGQSDPAVRYLARGRGYTLFLTEREAVTTLRRGGADPRVLRMTLDGARPPAGIEALEPEGTTNYFVGTASEWRRDVPRYGKVRHRAVYDGIDLVYHSQEGQLEYDFVVASGASPSAIAVRFTGAERTRLNRAGDLELATKEGTLVHRRPARGRKRPKDDTQCARPTCAKRCGGV